MPLADKVGSGRPVIVVHGTPGDRDTWTRVADRCPPGVSLWRVELADHGAAPDGEGDFSLYERDLEAVLREADGPVILGALSIGAFVCLRLLPRLGDQVARFVACAPVAGFSEQDSQMRRDLAASLRIGAATPEGLVGEFLELLLPRDERDALAEDLILRSAKCSAERLARAIERVAPIGSPPFVLTSFHTPTVIFHAERDAMAAVEHAERLAKLGEHVALHRLNSASHMLPLSHPAEIAKVLFSDSM